MNQSKKAYFDNIEIEALKNTSFRKVLHTGAYSQLVVMSLKPGEDIGLEKHDDHDQFIRIEAGQAEVILGEEKFNARDNDAFVIPSGIKHNVTNTSPTEDLKLYTIYSPAEHEDGLVEDEKI